jgi:ABC-type uncharacterized transport system, permease component
LLLSPDGKLLYASEGRLLRVWEITAEGAQLRETQTLNQRPQSLHILTGGQTLLIQDTQGVNQWFAIASDKGPRLQEIHTFNNSKDAVSIVPEPQRRVFATFNHAGEVKLFASKQQGPILTRQLAPGIQALAFAPRGDALIVERDGQWQQFALDNPWPDFTWRNLWQKIWYENYPQPDWGVAIHGGRRQLSSQIQPDTDGGWHAESRCAGSAVRHASGTGRRDVYRLVYVAGITALGEARH